MNVVVSVLLALTLLGGCSSLTPSERATEVLNDNFSQGEALSVSLSDDKAVLKVKTPNTPKSFILSDLKGSLKDLQKEKDLNNVIIEVYTMEEVLIARLHILNIQEHEFNKMSGEEILKVAESFYLHPDVK